MAGLEKLVREALINQRAEELVRCAVENPEYKSMSTELAEAIIDAELSSMASAFGDVDEGEMAEVREECRKEILSHIEAQSADPKQLRQTMYEQARNQYISVRQLKAKFRQHFADMREDAEIAENVVTDYEKAYEDLFEFARANDRMVKKLTKVAETVGVDIAIQKETVYTVTREMFPTAEKYRACAQRGMEVARNFFQEAQNALMMDGEMGQDLGRAFGTMGRVIEKAHEMTKKLQGNYLEKTIQEIYG